MKKIFLFFIFNIIATAIIFAQKYNEGHFKASNGGFSPNTLNLNGSRATYLQDSLKQYIHLLNDAGDSVLYVSVKKEFNSNGTIKIEDIIYPPDGISFPKEDCIKMFYNPTKPFQLICKKLYYYCDGQGDDALNYVDSFFYDSKDRLILANQRYPKNSTPIKPNALIEFTTYQYNTPSNNPDTILKYSYLLFEDKIKLHSAIYNTLDVKGNIVNSISLIADNNTDELKYGIKEEYKYNAQDKVIDYLYSRWFENKQAWIGKFNEKYDFKTNGDLNYEILLFNDTNVNIWETKDSTFYIYDPKGKKREYKRYSYDFATAKYSNELDGKGAELYDNNGNKIYEEWYNSQPNDPDNPRKKGSRLYWWSLYNDAVGVKELNSEDYQLIFANPLSENESINIKAKTNEELVLSTYSLSGEVLSHQNVQGNQTLTAQLPATMGIYVFTLSDKNGKVLVVKKFVKI